jgi:hypothetical protein
MVDVKWNAQGLAPAMIAMLTRCCYASIRPARPATPVNRVASTAVYRTGTR